VKDSFISVASEAEAIYKEKGSEFIARVYPVAAESECGDILSLVRKEYHDATHHTYAYRLADDTVRYSDDGEPSGTAGPRILNAIEKHDLYNVIVIVVRYFGGIKLGTGRLGKAYSTAANEVIAVCKKVERTAYRAAADCRSFRDEQCLSLILSA
jgi:putative IMPACT (imprinted ancient) family translation regulator